MKKFSNLKRFHRALAAASIIGSVVSMAVITSAEAASSYTILRTFRGIPTNYRSGDGYRPSSPLLIGPDGALYGSTQNGGSRADLCTSGCGTVFKLTPPAGGSGAWTETVLYRFQGGCDGSDPGNLVLGSDGAIYGTTSGQGESISTASHCGTAFKLTPPSGGRVAWSRTTIATFKNGFPGQAIWGDGPDGLTFGPDGKLYGITYFNGLADADYPMGAGQVFRLTPPAKAGGAWSKAILYKFRNNQATTYCTGTAGCAVDGINPRGGLLIDGAGVIHGLTANGGYGCGTVFELRPPAAGQTAWTETLSYAFDCGNPRTLVDGAAPQGHLTLGPDGAIYGMTGVGGSGHNGTIFKLTAPTSGTQWTKSVVYAFPAATATLSAPRGGEPFGKLAFDAAGALYGTTRHGGVADHGVLFKLVRPVSGNGPWTQSLLHTFHWQVAHVDGMRPVGTAFDAGTQALYGITAEGGYQATAGSPVPGGLVFRLSGF